MEIVFDYIQRLLDRKRNNITSEEDKKGCDFIQSLLDYKPKFYALDFHTIIGMLVFLGVEDKRMMVTTYKFLHSPELEKRYGSVEVVIVDPEDKPKTM